MEMDDEGAKLDGEDDEDAWKDLPSDEEDEFDEEGFANSENDEDDDEIAPPKAAAKLQKLKAKAAQMMPKAKGGNGGDLMGLLASAEEFADLIDEDQTEGGLNLGGSDAVDDMMGAGRKKKKAGVKQLAWERNQNEDWKEKKKFGGKKKGFNNAKAGFKPKGRGVKRKR